jgi:DNA-binding LacI/PurR family transcriptional regulator
MKARLATIKDVASHAGVSISTVSSVLNKSKPVSPDLAARINSAILELDYHPNRMAQSLNRRHTKTLAYLTPDVSNAGFLRLFRVLMETASNRGYTVLLINTDGSPALARQALRQIIGMRVDGVFVTLSWDIVQPEVGLAQLQGRGIEAVGIAGSSPVDQFDCFLWDEGGAGAQLGRYLRRIGHRQVLCIGPAISRSAVMRWDGMRDALGTGGFGDGILVIDSGDYTAKGGYDATQRAIAQNSSFTAVVAFNDAIATGGLAALSDQGIMIPDDVSFAAFGGLHSDFARPQITSMLFDEEQLAVRATDRLINRVEGTYNSPPKRYHLPLTLALRGSSRKLPHREGATGE